MVKSHHEISQNQAITISDHFAKLISTNTSARGEVFIAKKFRAVFILLNEVYVVAVCHKSDYPYDALRCANNAKLLMFEACKGVEVTVINLYKKFGQIMLALEELINETNTFKPPSTSLEMVGKSKLGEAHHVSAQYNGTSHIQSSKNLSSGSSLSQQDTQKKARRGTIKQMEKLISYTADEMWKEKQKQMEAHQKRFQILGKFQAPISTTTTTTTTGDDQIEEKSSLPSADDMLPDPTDIINFQFGFDFTAPDEEDALPSFNHKRAKSTNISTGSESNGISSFRKRQMEHIALGQQMFPLSEEEWHSLKVPALPENLKPVFIPPPTNNNTTNINSFTTLQPQKLPPKVVVGPTAFDRGDSKLITFEPFDLHGSTTSSKMEGEDTEIDMSDEDYTFRSDKQDNNKFTAGGGDSIYEYNPPKGVTTQNSSSSNILLPPPLLPNTIVSNNYNTIPNTSSSNTTTGNTISTNFLDDFLGPATQINNQNMQNSNNSLLLVDHLMSTTIQPSLIPNNNTTTNNNNNNGYYNNLVPPIPTTTINNNNNNNGGLLDTNKNGIPSVPSILPPPPQQQQTNTKPPLSTTSQPKITQPTSSNEPTNFLSEIQNKQLNPVIVQNQPSMFDPNELKKSIEQSQQKRAAVLPFKVLVTETVVKNMSGLTEEEYNFMGQIELILFNHESYRSSDSYKFILSLINDQFNNSENFTKIAKIVCNPKIAKELTSGGNDVTSHTFECNVTGQEINPKSQNAVILKYKLKEHLNLVPFKLRPLYFMATKDGQTMLNVSIDYIVNPATPLDKLSFLIRVCPSSEQITLKSQSKPEGRWNPTRQELLVNVEQPGARGSAIAKFLLNREVKDISELQTEFLCKFNAKGLLSGFTVEGGESKRSAHNHVFLGGCEYSITTPSWRYKLTSENLNPQFPSK